MNLRSLAMALLDAAGQVARTNGRDVRIRYGKRLDPISGAMVGMWSRVEMTDPHTGKKFVWISELKEIKR